MSCKPLSQSCPTLNTFYSPSKKKLSAVVALTTLVAGVVLIGIGAYYLRGSGAIASVSAGGLSLLGFGASSLYFIILSCKKTTKPVTHKAKGTQAKVAKNAPEQKESTEADGSTTQSGQVKVTKNAPKQKKTKNTENQDGRAKVAKKASEQKEPTEAVSSKVHENQAKSNKNESPTEVPFSPPSPKEIKGTQAKVAKSVHTQQKPTKAKSSKVQEKRTKGDKSENPIQVPTPPPSPEEIAAVVAILGESSQLKFISYDEAFVIGIKFCELFREKEKEFHEQLSKKKGITAFHSIFLPYIKCALDKLVAEDKIKSYDYIDYGYCFNIEPVK